MSMVSVVARQLLTDEEEVDNGAHHGVEDDGPQVAHEHSVVEGPGRLCQGKYSR